MSTDLRITDLETRLARVEATLRLGAPAPERPAPRTPERAPFAVPSAIPSAPPLVERAPRARAARPFVTPSLEDLLGGRVLAWAGGVAVLVGVTFFLALAASHGWIGEGARCLLAAAGALGLIGFGVRTGRGPAGVAAIGAGVAALDVDVAVATQTYDILPAAAGVLLALAVGALATGLAVRGPRPSATVGALGIVGGLLAPLLGGLAYHDERTLVLLLALSVPAAAVLVAQRWDRIALAAFAVTAPQLAWCFMSVHPPASGTTLLALTGFGVVWIAQAVGFELRTAAPALRPASAFLLTLQALVLASTGALVLHADGDAGLADAWLIALALAHLGVGLATDRLPRVSRELGLLSLGLGVVLADVGIGAALNGVAVPVAYALGALAFAALARALPRTQADHAFVLGGLGGHVLLAAAHALTIDAPSLDHTPDLLAAALALGAVAAASFSATRVATTVPAPLRAALDAVALAAIAWLAAIALPPVALAAAWAAEGAALALIATRADRRDGVAAVAAAVHLALAAAAALLTVAPATAIADGLADPLGAALALGALALALARAARLEPRVAWPLAGLTALFLASAELVTPLAPHAGQVALSALWAATGLATLVAGLRLDRRALRLAGLGLLLTTIGKVFLVDLATLDSAARAGSFLALGVLLLAAAHAWQRQRPALAG